MEKVKLEDIDFEGALLHAQMLVKVLKDAGYVAPEGMQRVLHEAAHEMNNVAKALKLIGGPK